MTPTVIGTLVFVCTFGGALVGLWLRAALPDQHLSDDSKDTVKVGIGLIATMTALVLGLVTASAKSSFDALNTAVKHTAADVLALDRTLARYGPESKAVRETLAQVIAQRLETTWPQHSSPVARLDHLEVTRGGEGLVEQIRALSPQNEHQRWLQAHAVALSEALLDARWVVVSSVGTSIPGPFLVVLVFWLTMIFVSFGLFAPRNATVIVALCVCALSVAGAIFGVAVQFVRKPTISSVRKINRLATTLVRFFNGINGFLRCRSIPCCCVRHPMRTGGGRENEPAAVLCHWKLHHPAEVDPRKVHGCNVAQHVCLDTPRSCVVPGVQDPLDAVSHPRHDDVSQQREGTGDGHQFLLTPAPCRGNTPEVDHPLQGMNGLAVVENP